jgi:hypothetical protein
MQSLWGRVACAFNSMVTECVLACLIFGVGVVEAFLFVERGALANKNLSKTWESNFK